MSSETRAAIIGAIVSALLSCFVTLWTVGESRKLEQMTTERMLASERANALTQASVALLSTYGDVTAVINMSNSEWYSINGHRAILEVLGADRSAVALKNFYDNTTKNRNAKTLGPETPGGHQFDKDKQALAQLLREEIEALYSFDTRNGG